MNAGIEYVSDLAGRPPFNGTKAEDYLQKIWRWKAALTHSRAAKVYLGYAPYCHEPDWRTTPAYRGTYYFDADSNLHFIHGSFGWVRLTFTDNIITARLAIIEEDTEGTVT